MNGERIISKKALKKRHEAKHNKLFDELRNSNTVQKTLQIINV
jgi:hypothetical protein